jgi:hypothetical protein
MKYYRRPERQFFAAIGATILLIYCLNKTTSFFTCSFDKKSLQENKALKQPYYLFYAAIHP